MLVKLQLEGLEGFIASKDEIDQAPSLARVGKAEFSDTAVSWWHMHREAAASPDLGDIQDRLIIQRSDHVKAIFRGAVRWATRTEEKVTRASDFEHLRVEETRTQSVSTGGDREQLLLVKGAGYDSFIVVSEREFDFSCLGSERTYGPGVNVGRLSDRLRPMFPEALYDDSLMQFTGEMGYAFRSSMNSLSVPGRTETLETEHNSNFNSVIQMARLLSMQHGLG